MLETMNADGSLRIPSGTSFSQSFPGSAGWHVENPDDSSKRFCDKYAKDDNNAGVWHNQT